MTANMRALSVVTCLLQGPFDCGYIILGVKGVMETMIAMTGAEEEPAQVWTLSLCYVPIGVVPW